MRRFSLLASALAFMAAPALADAPGKNWISRAQVSKMLAKQGYQVTKLEADDGHWEGEATKAGLKYEFHADPVTGKLTKLERDTD